MTDWTGRADRPLEVLKVDLVFDAVLVRETGVAALRSAKRMRASGTVGEYELAIDLPPRPKLGTRMATGTFGPLLVSAVVTRSRLTVSVGTEKAEVTLARDGSLQTLTGDVANSRSDRTNPIAIECIQRFRAPFDIHNIASPGGGTAGSSDYLDLELRTVEPITLLGESERAVSAMIVAFAVPSILHNAVGFGGGATSSHLGMRP